MPYFIVDFFESILTRLMLWRLRAGYGGLCETSDLDDFKDMYAKGSLSEGVTHPGRCPSCQASETIIFLERHLDNLKP